MNYKSWSLTDVGRVRSANEDSLGEAQTQNGHLFIVCDGMGGHVGGAVASAKAVESIIEFFQREFFDNPIQALDHAISFANEQIYATALSQPELKGMGTTAVVLLIRENECYIAHVGDSRIYLFSDGKLNRLTKDHSYVQTLVDANIIADEDAESHPNKNQILQALGIGPVVKSSICLSPVLPKVGDTFLLCSDGMNGMVNDKEMEHIMVHNNNESWSKLLIDAALNAGGKDNVTVSLIEIVQSPHHESSFIDYNPKSNKNFENTQEFNVPKGQASKPKPNFFSNKWAIFAGAGFLISIVAFLLMFLLNKEDKPQLTSTPPIKKTNKVVDSTFTLESINQMMQNCDPELGLKLNGKKCKDGKVSTLSHSCQDFTLTIAIDTNQIIKVTKQDLTVYQDLTGNTPNAAPINLKNTGVQTFEINTENLSNLDAVLKKINEKCENVKLEDLKKYNKENNTNLTQREKDEMMKSNKVMPKMKIIYPECAY